MKSRLEPFPVTRKKRITELAESDDLKKIGDAIKGICTEDSTLKEIYLWEQTHVEIE